MELKYTILFIHFLISLGATSQALNLSDFSNETQWHTHDGNPPKITGHRGEKVLMPENTLGSFEFASFLNVDRIEPDLVLTSDGHLVCSHDLSLKGATNIADLPQFADRKKNYSVSVDGSNFNFVNDWLIEDFTLEELKQVRGVQKPVGIRPTYFDDVFHLPSFQEFLDNIREMAFKMNRTIGLIPELKSPKFHNRKNIEKNHMEKSFIRELMKNGFPLTGGDDCMWGEIPCPSLVVQCFEKEALQYFKEAGFTQKGHFELSYLISRSPLELTYQGMEEAAQFADMYTIRKGFVFHGVEAEFEAHGWGISDEELEEVENRGGFIPGESFSSEAHKYGMRLGVWTIYDSREHTDLPTGVDKRQEMFTLFQRGADDVIVENIQEAREFRSAYDFMLEMNKK